MLNLKNVEIPNEIPGNSFVLDPTHTCRDRGPHSGTNPAESSRQKLI